MNYDKMTKAQLIDQLKARDEKRPELKEGNLILRRDPKVAIGSREKNPVFGYINIPENVSGPTRMAIWADLDADGNLVPGSFHGTINDNRETK